MFVKPRPNDRNMPTQHIATLLGATCCVRLATVLRCVATCWVLLAQIWPASNLSQQHATCRNRVAKRSQHVAPNNVGKCCAECYDLLAGALCSRWHWLRYRKNKWSFCLYLNQCHLLYNLPWLQKVIHRRNRETNRRQIPRTPSRHRERRQKTHLNRSPDTLICPIILSNIW